MTASVAVLDDYQSVALSYPYWAELGSDVHVVSFPDHLDDRAALVERLTPFEVVVAMRERTPLPGELLSALPSLKLIVSTGMNTSAVDFDAASKLGITVCGTGSPANATPELTWALILSLVRNLPGQDASVRAGGWQAGVGIGSLGFDLEGATLGVIGLGRIGRRVAAVGRAFGMRVLAWSTNLTVERARAESVTFVSKEELLRGSDVVSLHLRLGPRSRGVLGAAELAMMRPTAFLVNTSRGPLVDEAALVDALSRGVIAGAGLDVFDTEPLPPDHPLRTLRNTVVTPHIGYVSQNTYDLFYREVVEDIAAFLAGAPVRVLPR